MRATDLLECAVYDADGVHLGNVHDLRFDADHHRTGWTIRLSGILCGKRVSVGHHLGYGTGDMAGPWVLRTYFEQRHRRRLAIDWSDVARVMPHRIDLRRTRAELGQDGAK